MHECKKRFRAHEHSHTRLIIAEEFENKNCFLNKVQEGIKNMCKSLH
jgi:hypothetical protein